MGILGLLIDALDAVAILAVAVPVLVLAIGSIVLWRRYARTGP